MNPLSSPRPGSLFQQPVKAVNGRLSLVLDPAGIAVFLTGGGNDRGIDQRSGFDRDRLDFELCGHRLEQQTIQPLSNQGFAEADKGGALGRRLRAREAAEPPERSSIIKRLGQLYVRQVIPDRQQQGPFDKLRTCLNIASGGQAASPLALEWIPPSRAAISFQSSIPASPSRNEADLAAAAKPRRS